MNKKGFTAQNYIIGLILFSAVIALFYLMIGSEAVEYDRQGIVDSSFSDHYDKFSDNTAMADEMLTATNSKDGLNLFDVGEILLKSTFSVISLIFGSFTNVGLQLSHIPGDFNIPTPITSIILVALLSIITVTIIFTIINAVNKTNRL